MIWTESIKQLIGILAIILFSIKLTCDCWFAIQFSTKFPESSKSLKVLKMKLVLIAFMVCIAAVLAQDPIEISHNTVGDIININVDADAVLSNNVEANIVTVLLALLNQQAAVVAANSASAAADTPEIASS